jgi:lipoprotein-releasing system permease protein
VKIKGIDPTSASKVTDIHQSFLYGDFKLGAVPEKNCYGIAIGSTLADRLQVNLGDELYLLSPKGTSFTSLWGTPKMRRFVVTGIFQVGLYEFDASLVYISIQSAQLLLDSGDEVTGIEAKLNDIYKIGVASKQLSKALGYPYYALTWAQMYRHLFNWMKLEKWGSFIVLSLIILVAAFSIISTLVMMVMEKTREIGILKAMGATSKSIRKIFMLQGLVTGFLGTASGCVVGYLLCWIQQNFKVISLPADIYIINAVPVNMRVFDFICIAAGSLGICFLASLYPANKAASLQPVEAIRYE